LSALPLPENVFKLPKRPKIIEKAPLPDQRKFAVLPMSAVMDTELHGFSMKVLAVLCSYCNRAGITWVGQQRIADHLGVAKQQVARAMKQLRDRGHIEVVSKGFRGEKANTVRVIFAAGISTEDAIAITSAQEDTRPPEIRKREARAMTKPQEPKGEQIRETVAQEEFTEEQMAANRQRLKELLSGLRPKNHTTHQPVQIGAILMPRKTPKAVKKTAHTDNSKVVNEGAFIDNIIDYSGVVGTPKNIGYLEVIGLYEEIIKRRFKGLKIDLTTEQDVKVAELLAEVGVTAADVDGALTEPMPLPELAEKILNAKVAR